MIAGLKDVISVAPGDFNNDGLVDLCVLTASGPELLVNVKGRFEKFAADLPKLRFEKAVWLDYDHDYDVDLILLGDKSMLFRNQGSAGFQDHSSDFPFEQGSAIDAVALRVVSDTKGTDLAVAYRGRPGVLYRDKLSGKYEAQPLSLPAGAQRLLQADVDNDGWLDLLYANSGNIEILHNVKGTFGDPAKLASLAADSGFALADLENRGVEDLIAGPNVLRNLGGLKFGEPKKIAALENCRTFAAADSDSDGRVDLACSSETETRILLNETVTGNQWIRVRLAGIKNLKLSPGAEVEVKAGSRYQKRSTTDSRFSSVSARRSRSTLFGLRGPTGLSRTK